MQGDRRTVVAMGTLEVSGTIAISQFWPKGTSDADTVKIEVLLDDAGKAFTFTPSGSKRGTATRVFEGASVRGKAPQPAIRTKAKTGASYITVRLQGVDTPELHYRPTAEIKSKAQSEEQHKLYLELNEEYRQHFERARPLPSSRSSKPRAGTV